jgi:serine protease Do
MDPQTQHDFGRPTHYAQPSFPYSSIIWGGVVLIAFIVTLISLPTLVESVTAAAHRGPERAAAEEARVALSGVDAKSLSAGFELVAKAAAPSVVHINVRQRREVPDEIAQFFPSRPVAGQGSGVIVEADGLIVTNFHVIQGASDIEVHLSDGTVLPAQRVGADALFDLAVLKVDAGHPLTAIPWGNSDELHPGAFVWALGSPFGLDHSVTFGIISATDRAGLAGNPFQDFLQTDAAVNPGNSGGPLVNVRGELVGINTAIVGQSFQGISFALPSTKARKVYEELKDQGTVTRGWLGVAMRDATERDAQALGLPDTNGVVVEQVFRNTPAAEGGMRPGDVIVEWNGRAAPTSIVLRRLVAETPIGNEATVEIYRRGQRQTLKIRVAKRSDEIP